MKALTVKGKSGGNAFSVSIPAEELFSFLKTAAETSEAEFDDELATSAGGWATALFTAMMGEKHREAVDWDLVRDGWDAEKAAACFAGRLERKVRKLTEEEKAEKAAKALATAQAAWDAKVNGVKSMGLPAEVEAPILAMFGARPEAKK